MVVSVGGQLDCGTAGGCDMYRVNLSHKSSVLRGTCADEGKGGGVRNGEGEKRVC
jgi:hypothetical protein